MLAVLLPSTRAAAAKTVAIWSCLLVKDNLPGVH
jgi:hypothetical protein